MRASQVGKSKVTPYLLLISTDKRWCFPSEARRHQKKKEIIQVKDLIKEVRERVEASKDLVFSESNTSLLS
jgi:hypothetical protein